MNVSANLYSATTRESSQALPTYDNENTIEQNVLQDPKRG